MANLPAIEPLQDSDFNCSVCLSLLFKPCVLGCGHALCHFCLYSSMNSFSISQCVLCRFKYSNFPFVCHDLQRDIQHRFPAEYQQRDIEVTEEERIRGVFSPTFDEGPSAKPPTRPVDQGPACSVCHELCVEPCVCVSEFSLRFFASSSLRSLDSCALCFQGLICILQKNNECDQDIQYT